MLFRSDDDDLNRVMQESFDNFGPSLEKDSSKILSKNNIVKYKNINPDVKSNNKNCSICLNKFYYNQDVVQLECLHLFHYKCVSEWYKYKQECPVCRKNID